MADVDVREGESKKEYEEEWENVVFLGPARIIRTAINLESSIW